MKDGLWAGTEQDTQVATYQSHDTSNATTASSGPGAGHGFGGHRCKF